MQKRTLAEVLNLMEESSSGNEQKAIAGFAVDSRLLNADELFFALPGSKSDGHSHLGDVAKKGAAAAVVSRSYKGENYGLLLIQVDDPLKSLQTIARNVLKSRKSKVVAVTGSLGKTTTKEFLHILLKERYQVTASPGNSNSQIGLPLTILNHTTGQEEILILEMAMTESGQIAKLCDIAPPDIAIITKVALVHAGNFESLASIADAKAEIFSHPKTSLGVLARDLPNYEDILRRTAFPKLSFSTDNSAADYFLDESEGYPRIYYRDNSAACPPIELPGKHNRHNLLAAIVVAKELGLSWNEINRAIPKLSLPERRLQHIEKQGVLFINDSYNAAEESVKASLNVLPNPENGGKRIFVLGEMPGLGKFSEGCHRAVGEAALQSVDSMICIGEACKPLVECWKQAKRPVILCSSLEEVVANLKKQMQPGDIVLLKGANYTNLWKVLTEIDSVENMK